MCHQPLCQEEGKKKKRSKSLPDVCIPQQTKGVLHFAGTPRSYLKPIGKAFKTANKVINTFRPIGFWGRVLICFKMFPNGRETLGSLRNLLVLCECIYVSVRV